MSFDVLKYREMFAEEANELFDSIDNILLNAEKNDILEDEEINQLFRDIHTLKGSGASVELSMFAELTHNVENLMDNLKNHKIAFTLEIANLLIDAVDIMKNILDLEISNNLTKDVFSELTFAVLENIDLILNSKKTSKNINSSKNNTKKNNTNASFGFFNEEKIIKNLEIFDDKNTSNTNASFGFFNEENKISQEHINKEIKNNNSHYFQDKNKEDQEISKINKNNQNKLENILNENSNIDKKVIDVKSKNFLNNTIRVNLDKIDLLMNNVGDLVIANSILIQYFSTANDFENKDYIEEKLESLNRYIRNMQDYIMGIRMVPMESIYSKFPKVIRDISKRLNKKVEFQHFGDSVEIDKALIEGLLDPLTHIIRNSLDHGIETPEERILLGKPEFGNITISSEQANGQIIITIADDGNGIDFEKVAKNSLNKGIITQDEYNNMSDKEKSLLIFNSGISTSDKITDISGRGIGMDVVKTNIDKLGGIIKIESELKKGTTIKIILPLTLAILDGLDIKVSNQKYILPLNSIVESLQPQSDMIKRIGDGNHDLLMLREEFIPIIKLYQIFGVEKNFNNIEEAMFIVVKSGDTKIAILVDEFLNQRQIVVKPLDKNFRKVDSIGAATINGDGSVGLILDVSGIIYQELETDKKNNKVKIVS